jgi:hypothetical protein
VVARSKAFRYKGQDVDARKVGRQLKVRALLTGKVVQRGNTLDVQAELVDVERESQLWGERFHWNVAEIFAVEEEIARQIAEKLRLKLSSHDRAPAQTSHGKHGGLPSLSQEALSLEQEDWGGAQESPRLFSAGYRS